MIKTIKAGDKAVTLNNSVGWTIEYRDQFGSDILPAIMPLFAGGVDVISEILRRTGKTEDITLSDIMGAIDDELIIDVMGHLGALEFNDMLNVIWAMAKNADDSIPEPKAWFKEFDEFPLDEIVPEVVKLIFKGMVSSKNLKRLSDLKKKARTKKESTSTRSSSQLQSEG